MSNASRQQDFASPAREAAVMPCYDQTWLAAGAVQVAAEAFTAIDRHGQTPLHRELLGDILRSGLGSAHEAAEGCRCQLATQLPLLVHAALGGTPTSSTHLLAAALVLLDAGIYALDQILDREVERILARHAPSTLLLGGISLVSHFPQQVIASIDDDETAYDLLRMFADGLGRIGAGQLMEVSSAAQESRAADIALAVTLKTGERRALYAAMAARQAGADATRIEACAAFGRALGVARQLRSDIADLFGHVPSRDIASRTLTLPLALYLERGSAEDSRAMRALLAECPASQAVQRAVCQRLKEAGVLREVVGMIEAHCEQAQAALVSFAGENGAAMALHRLVRDVSVSSR